MLCSCDLVPPKGSPPGLWSSAPAPASPSKVGMCVAGGGCWGVWVLTWSRERQAG